MVKQEILTSSSLSSPPPASPLVISQHQPSLSQARSADKDRSTRSPSLPLTNLLSASLPGDQPSTASDLDSGLVSSGQRSASLKSSSPPGIREVTIGPKAGWFTIPSSPARSQIASVQSSPPPGSRLSNRPTTRTFSAPQSLTVGKSVAMVSPVSALPNHRQTRGPKSALFASPNSKVHSAMPNVSELSLSRTSLSPAKSSTRTPSTSNISRSEHLSASPKAASQAEKYRLPTPTNTTMISKSRSFTAPRPVASPASAMSPGASAPNPKLATASKRRVEEAFSMPCAISKRCHPSPDFDTKDGLETCSHKRMNVELDSSPWGVGEEDIFVESLARLTSSSDEYSIDDNPYQIWSDASLELQARGYDRSWTACWDKWAGASAWKTRFELATIEKIRLAALGSSSVIPDRSRTLNSGLGLNTTASPCSSRQKSIGRSRRRGSNLSTKRKKSVHVRSSEAMSQSLRRVSTQSMGPKKSEHVLFNEAVSRGIREAEEIQRARKRSQTG